MELPILWCGSTARVSCALLLIVLLAPLASGHMLNMTEAQLRIDPADGSVELALHIDLLRSLDSPEDYRAFAERPNAPDYDALWQNLATSITLAQGEQQLPLTVVSARAPEPFDPEAFTDPFRWPRMRVALRASGYNPAAPITATFTRQFVFEEPIALTIEANDQRLSRWLVTSQTSPAFAGPAALAATDRQPESVDLRDTVAPLLGTLWVGFKHILPAGVDHLMFVLTVLLLCTRLKTTALLVTAFTLGHSLSLAAAGFKLVEVPATVVEPLILLSICLYAVQVLRGPPTSLAPHYGGVAAVGLLHGLGFAAAFGELSFSDAPLAHLLSFNVGIELAQLLFVVCAFPVIDRYRGTLSKPVAIMLAIAPLLWLPRVL